MRNGKKKFISLVLAVGLMVTTISLTGIASDINNVNAEEVYINAQEADVHTLSNLQVKDYSKYTGKYLIYFSEPEVSKGYHVYIDDRNQSVKTIKSSGSYLTSEELSGFEAGKHTMYLVNIDADGKEAEVITTDFNITGVTGSYTDVPQVYIYTDSEISKNYHETADVSISIVDQDGGTNKDIIDCESNIKIRGHSTATAPKKPWNIKLSSKEKVLGMDKGKKWCLLANSFDKSLMRNKLAYDMGLALGQEYTSQSRFVEVYLNGVFQGNYLMTEPVEVKSGRVEIDAYNPDNNDILLELGTRNEADVDHFKTSVLNTTFDVNDPEKGDDLTDDEVNQKIVRVQTYLDSFENTLLRNDYDEILQYIDEDTFIDFYIINELFKNVDFNFSSTRFYIHDNKIYAGPLWDFDLSSGNCSSSTYPNYYYDGISSKGYYCKSMNWYRLLFRNEQFCNKISERYAELQDIIQNLYKSGSTEKLSIDYLVDNYGASFERNYLLKENLGAGWSLTNGDGFSYAAESGWKSWEQPIEFLRDWLEKRNEWLYHEWVEPDPDQPPLGSSKVIAEINGYQINTTLEGYRVVYSISDPDDEVESVGLIYGIQNMIWEEDMVVHGLNPRVNVFEATDKGKLDVVFSSLESSQSYARTMLFMKPSFAAYYNANMNVRAYAKLKDGRYIYSDIMTFTIYSVSNYLYQNFCMNTRNSHDYLYYNILKIANNSYEPLAFGWNKSIVKPGDIKR